MTENLEVKILPSGKAVARRIDGLPLTPADRFVARRIADELRARERGITAADVLRVFVGAQILKQPIDEPKPSCCCSCDKDTIPLWRRGGKIIQRVGCDGTAYWTCHYCGRRSTAKKKENGVG